MGAPSWLPLGLAAALVACGPPAASPEKADDTEPPTAPDDSEPRATTPLPWSDDPCAALLDPPGWVDDVARFAADGPAPPGQVLLVGSSTIRRWEGAARALAPWGVVQRGLGGARMVDLAGHVDALVTPHAPAAVLVFAGTNDVALGAAPADVVTAWRCFTERVHDALGDVPQRYLGVTPTPARWAQQAEMTAVNEAIAAWCAQHPALGYVDVPTAFLARGAPPDPALFVEDGLHLSAAGYALWEGVVRADVAATLPERPAAVGGGFAGYVRVDLGPANPEDGQLAPARDAFGNTWNAWPGAQGSAQVLAGLALRGLRTTADLPTGVDVLVAGGFRANGLRNGGLTAPPGDLLQTLAVPEATGDFFYSETADDPGALTLTGLDPAATYTLRVFASRASDEEVRVTRYVVAGASVTEGTLRTTGPDVGRDGYDGNDADVLVLDGVRPDAWGQLHLDVERAEGRFAYLSLLELQQR